MIEPIDLGRIYNRFGLLSFLYREKALRLTLLFLGIYIIGFCLTVMEGTAGSTATVTGYLYDIGVPFLLISFGVEKSSLSLRDYRRMCPFIHLFKPRISHY